MTLITECGSAIYLYSMVLYITEYNSTRCKWQEKNAIKCVVGYCRVIYSKEEMPLVTAGNTLYKKYILCLTH